MNSLKSVHPDSKPTLRAHESIGVEVLNEIKDVVGRQLEETGIEASRAKAVGESAAESVRAHFGGQVIYVPKSAQRQTRERWMLIWQEFDGHNIPHLANKYGMGVHAIYRILKIIRTEMRTATAKPEGGQK